MPFALLLALLAVGGATALTYTYDRGALLWSRLCAGVCVGSAALGLVGFALASGLGMTAAALALAGLLVGSPLLLLLKPEWRARLRADAAEAWRVVRRALASPGRNGGGTLVFYAVLAAVFWLVFANAMYRDGRGVFTGLDTNLGDLPFHVSLVTGFAHGENFPPEHTELAGTKLTYSFVPDFATAVFVRAGATLEGAFFWQNFLTMLALVGLLHRWALKLTGDRAAAIIASLLVLFSGGFGWHLFVSEAAGGRAGLFEQLNNLTHDYTRIPQGGYAWANAVTALFVPQRGLLLGAGLALIVWTLWWEATAGAGEEKAKGKRQKAKDGGIGRSEGREERKKKGRLTAAAAVPAAGSTTGKDDFSSFAFCLLPFAFCRMAAAGVVAGLLPLVHAHTFVVMMAMGGCLTLVQAALAWFGANRAAAPRVESDREGEGGPAGRRVMKVIIPWVVFAAVALLIASPQLWWATSESEVRAGRFFGWEFGWDHGTENVLWFWLKNTGLFIPLLAGALLWRGPAAPVTARLLYFYLPFVLCFVIPNLFKLSPWVWDNIKILFYWWVASAPLVALVLARLWRARPWGWAAALALVFAQTFAGGLDVWRAASGAVAHRIFDADGLAFAEIIKARTAPRSLILHAPTYNDPVYLTGRRTFLGYTGHLWSHGLDYAPREAELKRIYAGGRDAAPLLDRTRIDYVVVGPLERAEAGRNGFVLNEQFFERFEKVGEAGEYRLYQTRP